MKDELTTNGVTRGSFVERSVVAVAVSSMTIFSGIVNVTPPAEESLSYYGAALASQLGVRI